MSSAAEPVDLLRVFPLRQYFPRPRLEISILRAVETEMNKILRPGQRFDGMKIGVTANSRGIIDQLRVLRCVIACLRARGAEVVVIPAIGSHGGGSVQGELQVLADLGLTPEALGAPIMAGGSTRHIDTVKGVPVHCSEIALKEVDGVFVVGRTKEHTDVYWKRFGALGPLFTCYPQLAGALGLYWGLESGPHKTIAIGLAKLEAKNLHAAKLGLGRAIEIAARRLLQEPELNIIGGLSIVENAYDETAYIDGIDASSPDAFFAREREILNRSKRLLPHLPWATGYYDLLYVYRAGKAIAGQGVHTKALGVAPNHVTRGKAWGPGMPSIHTMVCSTLLGRNAMGRGKFQFVNQRYAKNVDEELTRTNAETAGYPEAIRQPVVCPSDRAMLNAALRECTIGAQGFRVAFIVSTMWMENVWLSEAFYKEASMLDPRRARICGPVQALRYDTEGNLSLPQLSEEVF